MSPRAGLDRCGKSRPHRDSIPGSSIPLRVAIPTELSWPINRDYKKKKTGKIDSERQGSERVLFC